MREEGRHSGTVAGGLTQFNAAYAVGGPACTIKTVEPITKVFIDHFVVVDFAGFKDMVDAIGGVKVCVPSEVDDTVGNIHLAGRHLQGDRRPGPRLRARAPRDLGQR